MSRLFVCLVCRQLVSGQTNSDVQSRYNWLCVLYGESNRKNKLNCGQCQVECFSVGCINMHCKLQCAVCVHMLTMASGNLVRFALVP